MDNPIHIFVAPVQPATNFIDDVTGKTYRFRLKKRQIRTCFSCGARRWAKNLTVQVYYDGFRFHCRDHG